MVGVGGVTVALVQEVGVVAMLHGDVAASRGVPMRVALGDQVRDGQLWVRGGQLPTLSGPV